MMTTSRGRCLVALFSVLFSTASSANYISPPTGSCSGSIHTAWLDVVFVIDSSIGMGTAGLRNVKAFLRDVESKLSVSPSESTRTSRMGVIVYGEKATVIRDFKVQYTSDLVYLGDANANLISGLVAAEEMFGRYPSHSGRQQVIVVVASKFALQGDEDPVLQQARLFTGKIVTLQYQQFGAGGEGLEQIASGRFSFVNDGYEVANVVNSLLHINCFCRPGLSSLSSSTTGSPDSNCVNFIQLQTSAPFAELNCEDAGGRLVKVDSTAKESALRILLNSASDRFWIGLRYNPAWSLWMWQDGSVLAPSFNRFPGGNVPIRSVERCVYSYMGTWYDVPCQGDGYDYHYFCEAAPCSAANDCFHPGPLPTFLPPGESTTAPPDETTTAAPEEPATETKTPSSTTGETESPGPTESTAADTDETTSSAWNW